jgi:hypothetical protein
MSDCPRFGKWVKGCKFVARYDTGPSQFEAGGAIETSVNGIVRIANEFRQITYAGDICVNCGKFQARPAGAK